MLMIGTSKNNGENYPRKFFFQHKEMKPGLSANRPSNNWAQKTEIQPRSQDSCYTSHLLSVSLAPGDD